MSNPNKISNVLRDDMAFFNSVLSYGIYTDREWMLGLNEFGDSSQLKSFDDIVTEAAFELYKSDTPPKELIKRNYELYISAYINNHFQKVFLQESETIEFCSVKYGYSTQCQFQQSDYFALNNLARAGYFLSKNEDGSQNLHLVFRGTDNKARDFTDFVGKAYLDMSAYYEAFKPLEEKILAFAKDPNNNIKTVHVSGHSLGGAMVQEFFNSPDVQNSGLDLIGFTYGAPGTEKKIFHNIITETFHTLNKVIKTGKFSAFKDLALNTLKPTLGKFLPSTMFIENLLSSVNSGINFYEGHNNEFDYDKKTIDNRIFQYEHSGDLIPKLGAAAYNEIGEEVYLKDIASKNVKDTFMLTGIKDKKDKHSIFSFVSSTYNFIKKPARFLINMFQFEYHDMMRYVVNLEHKITTENNKENSPYYQQFMDYKKRFLQNTSNKHEEAVYNNIVDKNNSSNNNNNNTRVYVHFPKDVQEKLNQLSYIQSTKRIVSDILGKPLDPPLRKNLSAGNHNSDEITSKFVKLVNSNAHDLFVQLKEPSENIHSLRKKFLNNNDKNKESLINKN